MSIQKPDPELGWKIINEIASQMPEPERSEFIADARDPEGCFTSGYISESAYRTVLDILRRPAHGKGW